MKIGGLASGMNTDEIIRDLMNANRIPLNKITQKKQYLEWQLDSYREVNRDLKQFYDKTFDNMIISNSFMQKKVDTSNSDALSVKNINSTGDFSGAISVQKLAKNSTMQGESLGLADGLVATSTLEKLGMVAQGGTTSITINAIGADGKMPTEAKEGHDAGVTLTFNSTDTLQSVLNKINKETGVTAFYDSRSGQIGMSTKHGGALDVEKGPEIVVTGDLGDKLKLTNPNIKVTAGQNAEFTMNGLEMVRSSNTFVVSGFEFTLKAESTAEVTFSSAPDTDKIVDNIVKFVDDYNTLIEKLNAQIREPKYRDFQPLSSEEKGDLTDKEIELWEEKAMSGTLRRDPIISSMLSNMRTALMGSVGAPVNGIKGPTLQDIGIAPSKDYLDNGKLIINEENLRKAINEDPAKVHDLFARNGENVEDKGFARKLRDAVGNAEKLISARAGKASSTNNSFTLGRNLNDMDKQITRFEDRLQMTESRLWKQFNAMEMAIQRLNAQSANLMSNFGG